MPRPRMLLAAFGDRFDGESGAGDRGVPQTTMQFLGEGTSDERRDVDAVDGRIAGVVDVQFRRQMPA